MKLSDFSPPNFPTLEEFIKRWVDDGYKRGPHYIGMLNHMFLWCAECKMYDWAELLVKNTNDFKYVCPSCGKECK